MRSPARRSPPKSAPRPVDALDRKSGIRVDLTQDLKRTNDWTCVNWVYNGAPSVSAATRSSDGTTVKAGQPVLKGAKVTAKVVRHGRDKKIVVFKFKRRKNYARKQGHRQGFTEVRITNISLG